MRSLFFVRSATALLLLIGGAVKAPSAIATPANTTVDNSRDNSPSLDGSRVGPSSSQAGRNDENGSGATTDPNCTGLNRANLQPGGAAKNNSELHDGRHTIVKEAPASGSNICATLTNEQQLHNSNTLSNKAQGGSVGDTTSTSKVTGSGNSTNRNSAEGGAGGKGVGIGKGGSSDASSASGGNTTGNTTTSTGGGATGGAAINGGVGNDSSVNRTDIDARTFSNPGLPSQPGRTASFGCNTVATASNGSSFANSNTGAVIGTGFGVNGYGGTFGGGLSVSSAKIVQGNGVCATQTTVDQGFTWLFSQPAAPVRSQSESAAGQGQGQAVIINMPAQPAQPPRIERRRASAESSNHVSMVQVDTTHVTSPQFGLLDAFATLFG